MIKKFFTVLYNAVRFIGCKCYKRILSVSTSTKMQISRSAAVKIGKGFRTRRGVEINARGGAQLKIGNNVFLNSGCIITVREQVKIGSNTIFGPNVMIFDNDHAIKDGVVCHNEFETKPVTIGENVWIGAGAIILKGATIGNNAIIAAGSIVKGNVESGTIFVQKRESTVIPVVKEEA